MHNNTDVYTRIQTDIQTNAHTYRHTYWQMHILQTDTHKYRHTDWQMHINTDIQISISPGIQVYWRSDTTSRCLPCPASVCLQLCVSVRARNIPASIDHVDPFPDTLSTPCLLLQPHPTRLSYQRHISWREIYTYTPPDDTRASLTRAEIDKLAHFV